MGIEGFKVMWEAKLPQLSERIKTSWYNQLSAVATSETPAAVSEAAFIAKGYLVGLLDAEVVDEAGAGLLGSYLVRIEQDAMTRLRSTGA